MVFYLKYTLRVYRLPELNNCLFNVGFNFFKKIEVKGTINLSLIFDFVFKLYIDVLLVSKSDEKYGLKKFSGWAIKYFHIRDRAFFLFNRKKIRKKVLRK